LFQIVLLYMMGLKWFQSKLYVMLRLNLGYLMAVEVYRLVLRKIISTILERETRVIVPVNCNAPEHDSEYIQIEVKDSSFAE